MSTFNPFRTNPLSPTSTGASVNTVTSYNPPPSFRSVARDDEITVFFDDVAQLPVISEEAEGEGWELSRTGMVMSTGTVREETGTRNGAGYDNVEFPAPEYLDDLPPYTPAPNFNRGEATLELGPRRPFQQPPRTPHQSAPTPASTPAAQGNNSSPPLASPSPEPFTPRQTPPLSSLNRGRRGPLGASQQRTEQIIDQFEQVSNSSGVGNLRSGAGTSASLATVTNSRPPQGQAQEILRHARLFSGVESRATVTNSRPSQGQAQEILRHARLFSGVGSRTTGGGGRLSPVQPGASSATVTNSRPQEILRHAHLFSGVGSRTGTNSVNTRSSAPASTTSNANSSQTSSIPSTANSGFARDFYAAGTGQGLHLSDDEDDDNVPLGMRRTGSGLSASASGDVRSRSFEGLGTSSMPTEPSGSGSNGPNGGTDDNRPTTRPVPGHALLKDGKILVYPKGFTCPICFNIGYKRSDPKRPCKKCWKKCAKPYSPVMSYASDAGSLTTLQRPLPRPN